MLAVIKGKIVFCVEGATLYFDAGTLIGLDHLEMEQYSQTSHEDVIRARRIALFMDSSIKVPGTEFRIGLDPIIGLIPGFGDFLSNAIGIYPISLALKNNLSNLIVSRMIFNLAIDYILGQIPIFGDIFDAFYKANVKNVVLLEKGLLHPKREKRRSLVFMSFVTVALIVVLLSPFILLGLILAAVF